VGSDRRATQPEAKSKATLRAAVILSQAFIVRSSRTITLCGGESASILYGMPGRLEYARISRILYWAFPH